MELSFCFVLYECILCGRDYDLQFLVMQICISNTKYFLCAQKIKWYFQKPWSDYRILAYYDEFCGLLLVQRNFTFICHVMYQTTLKNLPEAFLYTKSINYVKVAQNNNHYSTSLLINTHTMRLIVVLIERLWEMERNRKQNAGLKGYVRWTKFLQNCILQFARNLWRPSYIQTTVLIQCDIWICQDELLNDNLGFQAVIL